MSGKQLTNFAIACTRSSFWTDIKGHKLLNQDFRKILRPEDLTPENLGSWDLDYIFFPYWNSKISSEVFDKWPCYVFHVAPLPYGRGGSPVQNLIRQGFKSAPLNAIRVHEELDAGPVLTSSEISLEGAASDIFSRVSLEIANQILSIISESLHEIEQSGEPTIFKRIRPADNEIKIGMSLEEIYDEIRMVDSPDYLPAFVRMGDLDIELYGAAMEEGQISGSFRIRLARTERDR